MRGTDQTARHLHLNVSFETLKIQRSLLVAIFSHVTISPPTQFLAPSEPHALVQAAFNLARSHS
jgi:hypothetical protein